MKKYIQPAIKVQNVETEELMAASEFGINNKYSSSDALAKPNFDEDDATPDKPKAFPSVWDED